MSADSDLNDQTKKTAIVSASANDTVAGTSSEAETALAPSDLGDMPKEFGRYRILKKLGEGGMGAVFLALDTTLDRRVALKTPAFARQEDEQIIKRFLREAKAAATIQHPNVCPIFRLRRDRRATLPDDGLCRGLRVGRMGAASK